MDKNEEKLGIDAETYEKVINRLNEEKDRLERELRHEYRNARKYVRTHPEEGVAYAFLGGLVAGVVLSKLFSK